MMALALAVEWCMSEPTVEPMVDPMDTRSSPCSEAFCTQSQTQHATRVLEVQKSTNHKDDIKTQQIHTFQTHPQQKIQHKSNSLTYLAIPCFLATLFFIPEKLRTTCKTILPKKHFSSTLVTSKHLRKRVQNNKQQDEFSTVLVPVDMKCSCYLLPNSGVPVLSRAAGFRQPPFPLSFHLRYSVTHLSDHCPHVIFVQEARVHLRTHMHDLATEETMPNSNEQTYSSTAHALTV
jgi:hypothetical protein